MCKMNLASLLTELGERGEARRMHEDAMAGMTERFGPVHTLTLKCKMNLAVLLQELGERGDARVYRSAHSVAFALKCTT